jgi:hypothetical protein
VSGTDDRMRSGHHYLNANTHDVAQYRGVEDGTHVFRLMSEPAHGETVRVHDRDLGCWVPIETTCEAAGGTTGDHRLNKGALGGPCATDDCCGEATDVHAWERDKPGDNHRCPVCLAAVSRMAPEDWDGERTAADYEASVAAILDLPRAVLNAGTCAVCGRTFTAAWPPVPVARGHASPGLGVTYVCGDHR